MPTSKFPWRVLWLALLPFVLRFNLSRPEGLPAHLSRYSLVPILYAALSGYFFYRLAGVVFRQDRNEHGPALAARMVAGILVGVPLVFLMQFSMGHRGGVSMLDFGGGNAVISGFLTLLGIGYSLVDNPLVSLPTALMGYTISVGLAEETAKALVALYDFSGDVWDRAGAGFCAGVGFGIGEALVYAYRDYNGHSEWSMYLVRFVFCVGLHGCWSAVATLLLSEASNIPVAWHRWWIYLLLILPVAFVHGLYDVLLERHMPQQALLVAFGICALPAVALWVYEHRSEDGLID